MSEARQDQYPRITQAQFDIWVDSPVTKVYLQCLEWSAEQITETLGNGGHIDSDNNDKSMNAIHSVLGKRNGYEAACNPTLQLNKHGMLEIPKEDEEND